jgi:hypothetical protein
MTAALAAPSPSAAAPGPAAPAVPTAATGFDALLALLMPPVDAAPAATAAEPPAETQAQAQAQAQATDPSAEPVKVEDPSTLDPGLAAVDALAALMLVLDRQPAEAQPAPVNTPAGETTLRAPPPSAPSQLLPPAAAPPVPVKGTEAEATAPVAAAEPTADGDTNVLAALRAAAQNQASSAQATVAAPARPPARAPEAEPANQGGAQPGPSAKPDAAPTAATVQPATGSGGAPFDSPDSGRDGERKGDQTPAPLTKSDAPPAGDAVQTTAAAQPAQPAPPPRATHQTVTHLAAQIITRTGSARATQFDVTLDPQGLGQVTVQVRIAADGALTAAMAFDTPQAAAELRARADELQRALNQAGFNLRDGALSFDVAGEHHRQQHQATDQQTPGFGSRALLAAANLSSDGAPSAAQLMAAVRAQRAGGVDIRI